MEVKTRMLKKKTCVLAGERHVLGSRPRPSCRGRSGTSFYVVSGLFWLCFDPYNKVLRNHHKSLKPQFSILLRAIRNECAVRARLLTVKLATLQTA